MSSRVSFENLAMHACQLIDKLNTNLIAIPPHQREFCWPQKKQQLFIDTVQANMPTNSILLRKDRNYEHESLEDGRQRLTTLRDYMAPDSLVIDKEGRLFKDLPRLLQRQMEMYSFSVIRYSNATDEQAVDIFNRAQNGQPLTMGQRMYALTGISPIVKFAKKTLLTAGIGLHDRATAVWGARNGKDPKRTIFRDAVILAMSAVFGMTTKKWDEIEEKKFLSSAISHEQEVYAIGLLTELIEIYEKTDVEAPVRGKSMLNRQWSLSNFSPYILWSLRKYPAEHERVIAGWVAWLVKYRGDDSLLNCELKCDVSQARSWNNDRWKFGYLRIFDPDSDELPSQINMVAVDEDDTESED